MKKPENTKRRGRPKVRNSSGDARRRRENALAGLRELQLDQARGKLVKIEDVKRERAELGRQVRDAILNVPERTAYVFAAETDAKKIRKIHRAALCEALESLCNAAIADR
jgi:phage terminase Nu1 subunit (DNA packaging protein)